MACASPLHAVHDRFSDGDLHEMLEYFQQEKAFPTDQELLPSSSDSERGKLPGCEQSGTSSPIASSTKPSSHLLGSQMQSSLLPGAAPQCGAFLVQASNVGYLLAMPHQPEYVTMQQAAMQQDAGRDAKQQTVSHSTIEKQRRDRINSLIDELRELVPSAATLKGPDGADIKRPKHVVLSDTISLLKRLQDKVQQDELEVQQLKQQVAAASALPAIAAAGTSDPAGSAGSALSLLQRSLSEGAPAAAAPGTVTCPELPQAPVNLPASVGVLVEEGDNCYLVKINCKDRRGLLSDITAALKGLPLQIKRAAITTSGVGAVYDVFEIVVEPGENLDGVSALDIQFQVQQALLAHKYLRSRMEQAANSDGSGQDSSKRRRSE